MQMGCLFVRRRVVGADGAVRVGSMRGFFALGLLLFLLFGLVGVLRSQESPLNRWAVVPSDIKNYTKQREVMFFEGFESFPFSRIRLGYGTDAGNAAPDDWYRAGQGWLFFYFEKSDQGYSINNYVPGKPTSQGTNSKVNAAIMSGDGALITSRINLSDMTLPVLMFEYAAQMTVSGGSGEVTVSGLAIDILPDPSAKASDDAKRSDWITIVPDFRRQTGDSWAWSPEFDLRALGTPKGVRPDQWKDVRLRFRYLQGGSGIALDNVIILEGGNSPVQIVDVTPLHYNRYAGNGFEYIPVTRWALELQSGNGYYKLNKFHFQLGLKTGSQRLTEIIEKASLIRGTGSGFPRLGDRKNYLMAELKVTDDGIFTENSIQSGTKTEEKWNFLSGESEIYLVLDLNEGANVNQQIELKAVKDQSWEFALYDKAGKPVTGVDDAVKKYPQSGDPRWLPLNGQSIYVYKKLLRDGFEEQANWKPGQGSVKPRSAEEDMKVTEQIPGADLWNGNRYLYMNLGGDHATGYDFDALIACDKDIDVAFTSNIRMDYYLYADSESGSDGRVYVLYKDITDGSTNQPWQVLSFTTVPGGKEWQLMSFPVNLPGNVKKIQIGFGIVRKGDRSFSAYIDDVSMVGLLVENDAAVISVEPPREMPLSVTSAFTVRIENRGKNVIKKGMRLSLSVGTELREGVLEADLPSGQSAEIKVSGFTNLTGLSETRYDNRLTMIAVAQHENDHDPSNDTWRGDYVAYPVYEVGKSSHYPRDVNEALEQWYPAREGASLSWERGEGPLHFKLKLGGKPELFSNFQHSYIWGTGVLHAAQYERSSMVSPLLKFNDPSVSKQLILRLAKSEGSELVVEYRSSAEPGTWKAVTSNADGWYSETSGWGKDVSFGMRSFKVVLPVSEGYVQLRLRFTNVADAGKQTFGVMVDHAAVRPPLPDLSVSEILAPVTSSCDGPIGSGTVRIKVKNVGTVAADVNTLPDGVIGKDNKVVVPVLLEVFRHAGNDNSMDELFLRRSSTFSYSVPFEPGAEEEVDFGVRVPWDALQNGYRLRVSVLTEESGLPPRDEDPTNNIVNHEVRSFYGGYPIAGLVPLDNSGKKFAYYYQKSNSTTSNSDKITAVEQPSRYVKYSDIQWVPNGAGISGDGNEKTITSAGKLTVKYKATALDGYGNALSGVSECNMELDIDLLEGTVVKVESVAYASQVGDRGIEGCYKAGGESLTVKLRNESAKDLSNVQVTVVVDGEYPGVKASLGTLSKGAEGDVSVSGVKFPKGRSELLIFAVAEGGNEGALSSPDSHYRADIYRFNGPSSEPKIYMSTFNQILKTYTGFRPLSPDGQSIDISGLESSDQYVYWVDREPGVTVKWINYTGDDRPSGVFNSTDMRYSVISGAEHGSGYSSCPIDFQGTRAVYAYMSSDCGDWTRWYGPFSVKDGRVSLLGLPKDAAFCSNGEEPVILPVNLMNRGRASIARGKTLQFKVSRVDAPTVSQNFEVRLPFDIAPRSVKALEVGELSVGPTSILRQSSSNELLVVLESIGGETDYRSELRVTINVVERAKVSFNPVAIEGVQAGVNPLELKANVEPGHKEYVWSYANRESFNQSVTSADLKWSDVVAGDPNAVVSADGGTLTISGVPSEFYRLRVVSHANCRSEARVEFVQTNMTVNRPSAPDLKSCSYPVGTKFSFDVMNTGSRPVLKGSAVSVKVTAMTESLFEHLGEKRESIANQRLTTDLPVGGGLAVSIDWPALFNAMEEVSKVSSEAVTPFRFSVELSADGFKDVMSHDNKKMFQLSLQRRPSLSLVFAPDDPAFRRDLEPGSVYALSLYGEDVKVQHTNLSSASLDYQWSFEPRNSSTAMYEPSLLSSEIAFGTSETGSDGATTWFNVPNEKMYKYAKDKGYVKGRGIIGRFTLAVKDQGSGCVSDPVSFTLGPKVINLTLTDVKLVTGGSNPDNKVCDFNDLEFVALIKNTGSENIFAPKGTGIQMSAKVQKMSATAALEDVDVSNVRSFTNPSSFPDEGIAAGAVHQVRFYLTDLPDVDDLSYTSLELSEIKFALTGLPEGSSLKKEIEADNTFRTPGVIGSGATGPSATVKVHRSIAGSPNLEIVERAKGKIITMPGKGSLTSVDPYTRIEKDSELTVKFKSATGCKIAEIDWGTMAQSEIPSDYPLESGEATLGSGASRIAVSSESEVGCSRTDFYYIRYQGVDLVPEFKFATERAVLCSGDENHPFKESVRVSVANVGEGATWSKSSGNGSLKFPVRVSVREKGSSVDLLSGESELTIMQNPGIKLTDKATGYQFREDVDVQLSASGSFSGSFSKGEYEVVVSIPTDLERSSYYTGTSESIEEPDKKNNELKVPFEVVDPLRLVASDFGDQTRADGSGALKGYGSYVPLWVSRTGSSSFKDFAWSGPDGKSVELQSGGHKSLIHALDAGEYKVQFKDANGCLGSGSCKVRFPGYLTFVAESGKLEGTDICNGDALSKARVFYTVKNSGREAVKLSSAYPLPVMLSTYIVAGGNLTDNQSGFLRPVDGQDTEVAPGGSVDVAVSKDLAGSDWFPSRLNVGYEQSGRYQWSVRFMQEHDGKHAVDFALLPYRDSIVFEHDQYPLPIAPDFDKNIEAFFTSKGTTLPASHWRIPRDAELQVSALSEVKPFDRQNVTVDWLDLGDLGKGSDDGVRTFTRKTSPDPIVLKAKLKHEKTGCESQVARPVTIYFEKRFKVSMVEGAQLSSTTTGLCARGKGGESLRPTIDVNAILEYADTALVKNPGGSMQPVAVDVNLKITGGTQPSDKSVTAYLLTEATETEKTVALSIPQDEWPLLKPNESVNLEVSLKYPKSLYKGDPDMETVNFPKKEDLVVRLMPDVTISPTPNEDGIIVNKDKADVTITAVVNNSYPGANYLYQVRGEDVQSPTYVSSTNNEEVTFRVEDVGCVSTHRVWVQFFHPVSYRYEYGDNLGTVELIYTDGDGNTAKRNNGDYWMRGERVDVRAIPNSNAMVAYFVDAAGVPRNPNTTSPYEYQFNVGSEKVNLTVGFAEVKNEEEDPSTPGGWEDAVLSASVSRAVVVSPFREALQLYGTEEVVQVELYTLQGHRVVLAENVSGGETMRIALPLDLSGGVYLVHVYGADGGQRVIPVLKQ